MNEKVTCDVVKDLMPVYIDDCCSEDTKVVVESHIETCEDCAEELKTLSEGYTQVRQDKKKPELFKKMAKKFKKKYVVIPVIIAAVLCLTYGVYHFLTEAFVMSVKYSDVKITMEEPIVFDKDDWARKTLDGDFEYYTYQWEDIIGTNTFDTDKPTTGLVVPMRIKMPWSKVELEMYSEGTTKVISFDRVVCDMKEGCSEGISCEYFDMEDIEEYDGELYSMGEYNDPFDKIVFRDGDGDHVIWQAD